MADESRCPRIAQDVVLPGVLFFLVLLLANRDLFTVPIHEDGDLAANCLQVLEAKRFQALVGNYSRFGFHHPGPALFYVLAAGESLLFDGLGVVPAPVNAQILTVMALNVTFLFGALALVARRSDRTLFLAPAIALSILFVAAVNRATPGSTPTSLWTPHVLLMPFLFFLVSSACVAAGDRDELPCAVLAGMLLFHLHVSQVLFVGAIGLVTLVAVCLRERREPRAGLARWRRSLVLSGLVLGLFALPLLVDLCLETPSNATRLLEFARSRPAHEHAASDAIRYAVELLAIVPDAPPGSSLPGEVFASGPSLAFHVVLVLLAAGAAARRVLMAEPLEPFLRVALVEMLVVCLGFVVWAVRITGPLYPFLGFFVRAVLLFAGLVALAALTRASVPRGTARTCLAAACGTVVCAGILAGPLLHHVEPSAPDCARVAARIPTTAGERVELRFDHDRWPFVVGVACAMTRAGKPFCVAPDWTHVFGKRSGRRPGESTRIVEFRDPRSASRPAGRTVLFRSESVEVRCPDRP